MKINGKNVNQKEFAYDGCHKIYLIDDEKEKKDAIAYSYNILPIAKLEETYKNSCNLRFISNWKLTEYFVDQFEDAIFE